MPLTAALPIGLLSQLLIFQRPALILAFTHLLVLFLYPSIADSSFFIRLALSQLLALFIRFILRTLFHPLAPSRSTKTINTFLKCSIYSVVAILIIYPLFPIFSPQSPSISLPISQLEPGLYYDQPIAVSHLSSSCFNGRYSFQLSGKLLSSKTPITCTLKLKELNSLFPYRVPKLKKGFQVKRVRNHPALSYKIQIDPSVQYTNYWCSLFLKKEHAKMRMRHLKYWRKTFGSSMGSQFILALLHGHHHSTELSYTARRFGFSHLLAVSGMHIYCLCSLFLLITRLPSSLGLKRAFSPLTQELSATALLMVYCIWIGFNSSMPSITRALLMRLVWLAYQLLGRRYDATSAWGLSLALHALILPKQIGTISCALSYGATFALLQLLPSMTISALPFVPSEKEGNKTTAQKIWLFLAKGIYEASMAQCAIYLLLGPLILTFAPLPLLAFPINCLLTPITLLLLPFLLPLFLLEPIGSPVVLSLCKLAISFYDVLLYQMADLPRTLDWTIYYKVSTAFASTYILFFVAFLVSRQHRPSKTTLTTLSKLIEQSPI